MVVADALREFLQNSLAPLMKGLSTSRLPRTSLGRYARYEDTLAPLWRRCFLGELPLVRLNAALKALSDL